MSLSKTAAIRQSQRTVSIHGRGTSWTIVGPHRYNDPKGPYTEMTADSYTKARTIATTWRARVALALMGKLTDEADCAVNHIAHQGPTCTIRQCVDAGLSAA
jgi:hypothetical protein